MFYLLFALLLNLPLYAQTDPVVSTQSGEIIGVNNSGNEIFLGIPYAQPPVGNLRWRSPQPVAAWSDPKETKNFVHDCMQVIDPNDTSPLRTEPSEDCLYLNVWRPSVIPEGRSLPVMVWIHGGGYTDGGTSREIYDGESLSDRGVVVVTLNYRLGRFGFFAHPSLTKENAGKLGNYGLEDQLAALKWVQANIRNFGGDPGNVTLIGESAGGASVVQWLTSQESSGLFHKAIVMSGGGRDFILGNLPLSVESPFELDAEKTGVRFAQENGISSDDENALTKLRALSAADVRGDISLTQILQRLAIPDLTYAGGPIIDGQTVTALPASKFASGQFNKVPLIIGTTEVDLGVAYASSKDRLFENYFKDDAEEARGLYDPKGNGRLSALILTVGADFMMQEPARFVAGRFISNGSDTWVYRFSYVPQKLRSINPGAIHGSDVPFVFNTLDARYGNLVSPEDRVMAESVVAYFTTFATTGMPAPYTQPEWGVYDSGANNLLMFGENGPMMESDPWTERLNLVEKNQI